MKQIAFDYVHYYADNLGTTQNYWCVVVQCGGKAGQELTANDLKLFFPKATDKELLDPWGSPYHIVLDVDRFGHIKLPDSRVIVTNVCVWSSGPNAKNEFGAGDDISSWKSPAH